MQVQAFNDRLDWFNFHLVLVVFLVRAAGIRRQCLVFTLAWFSATTLALVVLV